jgi:hypothetical protein
MSGGFTCTDYTRLFRLDAVTTEIWHVFFDLIILSILCQPMVYAFSNHNNLDSLWLIFIFSLRVSQALLISTRDTNLPTLQTYLRPQYDISLYLLPCLSS